MFNIFKKKPQLICFFCKISVSENETKIIKYKASDGFGEIRACPMCSATFDELIDMRGEGINE